MNFNKIYVTMVTISEASSTLMHMTHDKERHDKYVKDTKNDIEAGADHKGITAYEVESIDCQNLWLGVFPEYSPT